jgi:MinD-like ATPase involved in chromosome partitioning or flagellar assembly
MGTHRGAGVVTPVRGTGQQPPAVERALGRPGTRPGAGWRSHVTVVPGGQGPGRPDPIKEAKARAVLPLDQPRLTVVLGCTVGAGQTMTALMLADLLASLREEPVAALDLNPGPTSLTELAGLPATPVSALLARRATSGQPAHAAPRRGPGARGPRGGHPGGTGPRADIICDDPAGGGSWTAGGLAVAGQPAARPRPGRLFEFLASRYTLTVADPGAAAVARVLPAADQLVLVAPASPDAARAVGMTLEWLSANGHGALSGGCITVLNGVSQRSVRHAEQAEVVVRGRVRAIVRVPWDDHLAGPETGESPARAGAPSRGAHDGAPSRLELLRPPVLAAYTALAGVVVSSLASGQPRGRAAR